MGACQFNGDIYEMDVIMQRSISQKRKVKNVCALKKILHIYCSFFNDADLTLYFYDREREKIKLNQDCRKNYSSYAVVFFTYNT